MAKLLADTSFLIDVFRFGLTDELEEYEMFTVSGVMYELGIISRKKTEEGKYARLAIRWLEARGVQVLQSDKRRTDDMIVDAARGFVVGTSDIELRKRLKSVGAKIIYVRVRKHLELG